MKKRIIAVNSNCYHGYSIEQAVAGIRAAGFKYIELTATKGWTEHVFPDQSFKRLLEVQDLLDRNGLIPFAMSGLSGGWDSDGDTMWFLPDTDDSAETLFAAGYDTVTGTWQRCGISTGEARYPRVKAISTAGGAVWAMIEEYAAGGGRIPDDAGYYLFYKNLNDGTELLSRIPLAGDAGTESSMAELHTILALDGSHVLLTSPSSTYVLDPAANVLGSPALGLNGWPNYMRVNGQLYIYRWDAEDEGFWLLDTDSMSYSRHIPVDGCGCFSSSAGNFNCTVDGALRRFDRGLGLGGGLYFVKIGGEVRMGGRLSARGVRYSVLLVFHRFNLSQNWFLYHGCAPVRGWHPA